eukprot:1154938-Pelagomonas_calceolata.AAC.1
MLNTTSPGESQTQSQWGPGVQTLLLLFSTAMRPEYPPPLKELPERQREFAPGQPMGPLDSCFAGGLMALLSQYKTFYASQRSRVLRKGPLTSRLERTSPKPEVPPNYTCYG